MFKAGGSVASLGSNEFIVGGIRYQLSDDKLAELRQGIGSDMSIFPIINAPGAQFGSEVEQALREYSRLREPFQLSEKFGEGFESRGEAFSDQDSVRPDSVLSAVQELARRGGSFAREYVIDPVVGIGGELFGGEKGREAAIEGWSKILGRVPTEEELAIIKAEGLTGSERVGATSDVTFTPAAQQMLPAAQQILESQDFQRELDDLVGELNQAEQETDAEETVDASVTAGEEGDAGAPDDSGVEDPGLVTEDRSETKRTGYEEELEQLVKKENRAKRFGRLTSALSNFYEPGMTRAESMISLGKKLSEETEKEQKAIEAQAKKELEAREEILSNFNKNRFDYEQDLSDSIKELDTVDVGITVLRQALEIVKGGGVAGLGPVVNEAVTKAVRFAGFKKKLTPRMEAKLLLDYFAQGQVKNITGESGRTISNVDREIAARLVGNINKLFATEEEIQGNLERTLQTFLASYNKANRDFGRAQRRFTDLGLEAPYSRNIVDSQDVGSDTEFIGAKESEEIARNIKAGK
jgi:hypothetical protein